MLGSAMAPQIGNQKSVSAAARVRRMRSLRGLLLLVILAALVASVGLVSPPDHHVGTAGAPPGAASPEPVEAVAQARLTISPLASSTPVPRSFFGLSAEYWTLPLYEQHPRLFARVLSQLHVRGEGPLILRIGGDSADHARWEPRARPVPPWVLRLTPRWLSRTRSLVRRASLRLILDLNVATGSAVGAASWARAAERRLPRHSILAFEVGNEPDVFDRSFREPGIARQDEPRILPRPISLGSYARDFEDFARALSRAAPRVPLIALGLASPRRAIGWIAPLIAAPHPGLRAVSAHNYPYSACAKPGSSAYPTITRLLNVPAAWARTIGAAATAAHRAGLQFRLTELNSISCGGLPGVSNSFATALWAPDALFQLLRAGVDGVNLHTRAYPINAPFAFVGGKLRARPLLYGMILFARTLGPGARLLHVRLHVRHFPQVKVWAVRLSGNILHVLIIDKAQRAANLRLRLPAVGRATVERLLAPSAAASRGVTLGGQHLGPNGSWRGRRRLQHIRASAGGYQLKLPGMSAALVTVHIHGR
jgi:hypothetical protein